MWTRHSLLWTMLLVPWFGACAPTMQSGGFTVNELTTLQAFDDVKRRASFDLGCRMDQLETVVLDARGQGYAPSPDQIGVSGCGRRGVYVYTRSGWVMNTESRGGQ